MTIRAFLFAFLWLTSASVCHAEVDIHIEMGASWQTNARSSRDIIKVNAAIATSSSPAIGPRPVPDGHFGMGQSWESNPFSSFGSFGIPPLATLTGHYQNTVTPSVNGPLSSGAGISLPAPLNGITSFSSTDTFSITSAAIVAQNLLRIRENTAPTPIIEFVAAYPSSSWTSGPGGGLAPGASFTASVTADLMTVTGSPVGTIVTNQSIVAAGLDAKTVLVQPNTGSGTGGAGTYDTTLGQFFADATLIMTHATVVGHIQGSAANPGNVFLITSVTSGTVTVGDTVPAPALAGTTIISGSGTTWKVRVGAAQSVGSEAMVSKDVSWTNMLTIQSQLQAAPVLPNASYQAMLFSSFDYTQGGATDNTRASKIADLVDMRTKLDALNLPGAGTTGLIGYFSLPSAISTAVIFPDTNFGTYDFCKTNAPGAGGTWSGRTYATSPSYAWPFSNFGSAANALANLPQAPRDNIHTGDYGTARWGENLGYIRHQVQDKGVAWTPLWRSAAAITLSGQIITIPFSRPTSSDFAATPLVFQGNSIDGISLLSTFGFHVFDGAADLALSSVAIDGLNIVVTLNSPPASGHTLEVSYAWHGPGGSNPGANSGVRGNLVMNGPASVFFAGKTIDAWAWPFIENIVVP